MGETTHKRCSKCLEVKPAAKFSKDATRKSGLRAACMVCTNARASHTLTPEQRARKRERERARRHRDRKEPTGKYAPGTPGVIKGLAYVAADNTPTAERWLLVRPCRKCGRAAKLHVMQVICNRCEPRASELDEATRARFLARKAERRA